VIVETLCQGWLKQGRCGANAFANTCLQSLSSGCGTAKGDNVHWNVVQRVMHTAQSESRALHG
jgi:hypothetical protein